MSFRRLEQALIRFDADPGGAQTVLDALGEYQNPDGGFGHGLEPDFLLPDSSAMATSIGLRLLHALPESPGKRERIRKAVTYLWNTYDPGRPGWWAVPEAVNLHPHAPWWDWENGMTVIDRHWGNPNAELLGYLLAYDNDPRIPDLLAHAVRAFEALDSYDSEHELFCMVRLCEVLPASRYQTLKDRVAAAVRQRVVYDPMEWKNYVPGPLDFLKNATSNWLGIEEQGITAHLRAKKSQLDRWGYVEVNWPWDWHPEQGPRSLEAWRGVLTREALLMLRRWGGRS